MYWVIPEMYGLKATLGYWVVKYDADVLVIYCGMTNKVNMDGSSSEAMPGYWVERNQHVESSYVLMSIV